MTKIKLVNNLGLMLLALLLLPMSRSLAQPSETPGDRHQERTDRTVPEPSQEFPNDRNAYELAIEKLSVMAEDMPVEFPLGEYNPISIERLPNDVPQEDRIYAIGFILNGRFINFTVGNIIVLFEASARNPDLLTSRTEAQSRRIPVMDLIVRENRTNRRSVVHRVNARLVRNYALNAVLNQTIRKKQ